MIELGFELQLLLLCSVEGLHEIGNRSVGKVGFWSFVVEMVVLLVVSIPSF